MSGGPQGPVDPAERAPQPIDGGVRIGHVHLRTADIDRVRDFYVDVLGFDVMTAMRDVPGWGGTGDVLFVAAGGYHHHLGFNVWRGHNVPAVPADVVGLRHWTVVLEDAAQVAAVAERVRAAGLEHEAAGGGLTVRDPWDIKVRFVAGADGPR